MKKIFVLAVSGLMMVSCGMMKGNSSTSNSSSSSQASETTQSTQVTQAQTTQTNQATQSSTDTQTTAYTNGQGAGNALLSLYNQYKADGKYDYKNIQNLMNTMQLVANCEGLKTNYKDTDYLKQFGTGLIASSLGLVTQNNVQTVTTSLVDMVKNSETVQNATEKVQSATTQAQNAADKTAQYASAISALLGALK
ncbi:MAG: hypothetical protein IJS82_05920 [Paludibacteraceae bacterium]|nr:hypothetical protein [Paludibacteraceae bacterium]